MDRAVNRRWCIVRRPEGLVRATDLEFIEGSPVPRPGTGEALIRNELLSVDPANRIWMWKRETYLPPQDLGDVVRGICIGKVIESNNPSLRVGMPLYGMFGWQDYAIVGANDLVVPLPEDPSIPLTLHLALFGHIGMTAYFGLLDVAKPKAGETLVVSAAAGAVGSLVGQLGKILGCRVIGTAGSDEKCEWITRELGFDAAINYRGNEPLAEALAKHCPNGVDVYFDSVGGETLETVLDCIGVGARIVLCGMVSGYNVTGEEGRARPARAT